MKIIAKRKKGIFTKLVRSYILVIAFVTMTITAVIYFYANISINKEIKRLNEDILYKYTDILNADIIQKTQSTVNTVVLDEELMSKIIRFSRKEYNPFEIYELYNDLLQVDALSFESTGGIHIYAKDSETLVSTVYGYKKRDGLSASALKNMLWIDESQNEPEKWYSARNLSFSANDYSKGVLTYVRKVTRSESGDILLVVDVSLEYLEDVFSGGNVNMDSTSVFYLADIDGNQIISSDNGKNITELNLSAEFYKDNSSFSKNVKQEGKNLIVSYVDLDNGWRLFRTTNVKDFYSSTYSLILVVFAAAALIFILGYIFSYKVSKSFYSPIALLADNFSNVIGTSRMNSESYNDEFNYMNSALLKIENTISQLNTEKSKESPLIKQNIVKNAVHNLYISNEMFENQLEIVALAHPYIKKCCALILRFEKNEKERLSENQYTNKKINIINYIESNSNDQELFLAAETDTNELTILALCEKEVDIRKLAVHLYEYALSKLETEIDVSYGKWYDKIQGLSKSYEEAVTVYKHKFFMTGTKVFSYEIFEFNEAYDAALFTDIMKEMDKALKLNRKTEAINILDEFIKVIKEKKYKFHIKQLSLYNFALVLMTFMSELQVGEDIALDYYIEEFRNIDNIDDFEKWYIESIEKTSSMKNTEEAEKNNILIKNTIDYINNNIHKDLSLTAIAEEIKLSKNYISKLFYDAMGMHITEYITQIRMDRARELLESTDHNVGMIAEKTGYATTHYFIKKFREYYGRTPKAYRSFLKSTK